VPALTDNKAKNDPAKNKEPVFQYYPELKDNLWTTAEFEDEECKSWLK
jgi:ABC-type uncharacterized transport system YnjBCD substrate-binding protein